MPKPFEDLVSKLKGKKGVDNPYALGRYIMGSDAQIKAGVKPKHGGKKNVSRKRNSK